MRAVHSMLPPGGANTQCHAMTSFHPQLCGRRDGHVEFGRLHSPLVVPLHVSPPASDVHPYITEVRTRVAPARGRSQRTTLPRRANTGGAKGQDSPSVRLSPVTCSRAHTPSSVRPRSTSWIERLYVDVSHSNARVQPGAAGIGCQAPARIILSHACDRAIT